MAKVLHFVSNAEHCYFLYPLIDYHDRSRFEVVYGTLSPAGVMHRELEARGVRCFALGCTRRRQFPLAALRLARIIRREKINIIHGHLFEANLVGMLASRLAMTSRGVFTGQHSHECALQREVNRKRYPLWLDSVSSRWLSHRAVAHSDKVWDVLVRREKVPPGKVVLIPNGFDLARFRPSHAARQRIRAELGLRPEDVVVASVGRLYWVKNHKMLIEVFANLAGRWPALRLVIAGEGNEEEALRRQVSERSLEGRVILTGNRPDIPDFLSAVDVYAHPSHAEAFCLAIAEAVAMGRPVVTTDVGGAADVVEDGVNGYVVPPGDAARFQEALTRLLQSPDGWRAMGDAGRRRIESYAIERVIRKYESLYESLLNMRRD